MTPKEREQLDQLHTHVLWLIAILLLVAVVANILALWGY